MYTMAEVQNILNGNSVVPYVSRNAPLNKVIRATMDILYYLLGCREDREEFHIGYGKYMNNVYENLYLNLRPLRPVEAVLLQTNFPMGRLVWQYVLDCGKYSFVGARKIWELTIAGKEIFLLENLEIIVLVIDKDIKILFTRSK